MVQFPDIYPWQQSDWERIAESLNRLPHAILIAGTEGIGKFRFASRLAMALLCETNSRPPCGGCRNCRLFGATTHPDLHVLTSESKLQDMDDVMVRYAERYLEDDRSQAKRKTPRASIVIDQIRALIDHANVKPHLSERKVFLLDPVDTMTMPSAHSILKILEEPPVNTFLILIAENVQKLLPTILSRCQNLNLSTPDQDLSERWLNEQKLTSDEINAILDSRKGPLVGLRRAQNKALIRSTDFFSKVIQHLLQEKKEDIFHLVELGVQLGESECLDELHVLVSQLIGGAITDGKSSTLNEPSIHKLARQTDIHQLFSIYDHIGFLREQFRIGGVDKTLAVEDALLTLKRTIH